MNRTDIDFINEYASEVKLYIMDTMPNYYLIEELDERKLVKREIIKK